MIWKINFGLWAVAWAGQWGKGVLADYEQLLRPVFFTFSGSKIFFGGGNFFFQAKNALRSGTDYCWLYCGASQFIFNFNFGLYYLNSRGFYQTLDCIV
jgi:hypothetical protein